jgi:4-amino-4-deoxy-L-arabinose transferase-like glycosyltransferase
LNRRKITKFLVDSFPLLCILVGVTIVLISVVPFTNGDTQWEYEAVLGVIRWGKPYVITHGNMINQPPLGFYIGAFFFKIFGSSIENGVNLISIISLGSLVLVYKLGSLLYGKTAGSLAALFFAFTPWQVVLSRSFLIDSQCLFFSLFSLTIGIISFQKKSLKLFFISGILFAAAFLTKFYAVFSLIPISLFYFYYQKKKPKNIVKWFITFIVPVLLAVLFWYEFYTDQGLLSLFIHKDFADLNPDYIEPSILFVGNFLFHYGLGRFLTIASIFSVIICFIFRKIFSKIRTFDLICLITIVTVIFVNIFLGVGLNLRAPYYSSVKYSYHSLPFFCLLGASLLSKCFTLYNFLKNSKKRQKFIYTLVLIVSAVLIFSSILTNIFYVHLISLWPSILFRFDLSKDLGYFLFHYNPIDRYHPLLILQYFGFMIALSGFIFVSLDKIKTILYLIIEKIKPK